MSRNYSPRTFLRKTPNKLLRKYFEQKDILSAIEFEALGETDVEPITAALDQLPPLDKARIEHEFLRINDMACSMGVRVLLEEAQSPFHGLELADMFEQMSSHYERAFWMFLNHPIVFDIASDLAYMDSLSSWRRRSVGAGLVPAVAEQDKANLAAGLSNFYRRQGRGHRCHVDNYLRQNPERHCYFAYPEDYATTDIGFDEKDQLYHRPRKPAFEVVFVYRPEAGVLETNAKGKSEEIKRLQEIFCRTILGLDGLPAITNRHFDLSRLKDKNLNFVTDPSDGVEGIFIKMLRFDLPGMGNRRITFEASSPTDSKAIHKLIEKALNKSNVALESVFVAKARLQFKFSPKDGKRGKTLTFEISTPDRCTLKDDPLDQIAKKYIARWGFISG